MLSVEDKFLADKYARPKHEGKRKICSQNNLATGFTGIPLYPKHRSNSTPQYVAERGRNYMERSMEKRRSDLSNNHAMIYIDLFVFHIEWKVVFLP